ncbi:MAG: hypothetical protein U5J62_04535 [Desulfurivibrio sp.]|nr:hypothetical protein [Desulfurivibrio sp.]
MAAEDIHRGHPVKAQELILDLIFRQQPDFGKVTATVAAGAQGQSEHGPGGGGVGQAYGTVSTCWPEAGPVAGSAFCQV